MRKVSPVFDDLSLSYGQKMQSVKAMDILSLELNKGFNMEFVDPCFSQNVDNTHTINLITTLSWWISFSCVDSSTARQTAYGFILSCQC